MGELLSSTPAPAEKNGWLFAADRLSAFRVLTGGRPAVSLAVPAGSMLTFDLLLAEDAGDGERTYVKLYIGSENGTPVMIPADRSETDGGVLLSPEDGSAGGKKEFLFRAEVAAGDFAPEGQGLFRFHWEADTPAGRLYSAESRGGRFFLADRYRDGMQMMVYRRRYDAPEWLYGGVFYQIFVDRFRKSGKGKRKPDARYEDDWEHGIPEYPSASGAPFRNNTHFGGDLYGVIEKLDYLRDLGVTCLYLSPIGEAYSNHKYDTGDYLKVDESFGGDEAFVSLCREAHARGMRVLLDGVFNHVGSDSVYFNRDGTYPSVGAFQSDDSPYASWFTFWGCRDEYDSWWGMKNLPKTVKNESFVSFICGTVIPKYMDMGADGYRLDVVDELDGGFVERICAAVKEKKKDGAVLGEVWEDASVKVAYGERKKYFQGDQLDGVMNYPFRAGLLRFLTEKDPDQLRSVTETLVRHYPPECLACCMNFLGTHDTSRVLTVLGGDPEDGASNDELAVRRMTGEQRSQAVSLLKCGYALLAALPGIPCIYYGDEAGMEGYHDPFNRFPFPWGREDGDLTAWFARINRIRKEHDVFRAERFRVLESKYGFFAFERKNGDGGETLIAACNLTGHAEQLTLPAGTKELLTGALCAEETLLPPASAAYYLIGGTDE